MTVHRRPPVPHRLLALAVALPLVLTACGDSGPGSEEDLTRALTREGGFDQAEAECITAAVFAKYGADEDALKKISRSGSYEDLSGTDGVEGFSELFDRTVAGCTGG